MPHGSPGSNQPPGTTAVADCEAARQPAATADSAVASKSAVCIQESPENDTCKKTDTPTITFDVSKQDSCLRMKLADMHAVPRSLWQYAVFPILR